MTDQTPEPIDIDAPATAALPRSPLHLGFLITSDIKLDIVFYRDAHLYQHMPAEYQRIAVFLGREVRWPAPKVSLRNARCQNRRYQQHVRKTIARWSYARFILFLESEPLENLIRDTLGDDRVELWEEGLSHYADFHGPLYDLTRSSVQYLAGFYPNRILHRRADRSRFCRVRDRFEAGGLPTTRLANQVSDTVQEHDAILFVGAPLVQDHLVSSKRFVRVIEQIVIRARHPVVYYAHPRENTALLQELVDVFGADWFYIKRHDQDVVAHVRQNRYLGYVAAFSTALLDLSKDGPAAYCPALFRLSRVQRNLAKLRFLPVNLIQTWSELGTFFESLEMSRKSRLTAAAKHNNDTLTPEPV